MEGSVLGENYMDMCSNDAIKNILRIKNICKKVDGSFVLLWHNTYLDTDTRRKMYKDIIN